MPAQANGLLEQPSARTPLRARVGRGGRPKRASKPNPSWERSLGEHHGTPEATDSPAMMDRLLGEIHELEELTRTLLDRDRAASCEVTDLVGVAQAAADTVRAANHASGVLAPPPEPVGAVAQPGMARQALENLIENAARHSEEPVEVTVRQVGEWAEVVVADRGAGWGRSARHAHAGNGLGLALVRHVTESAGGHLWSRGRPGGGTMLGLRLPAAGLGMGG